MKGTKLVSDGVLTTASSEGGWCCFVAGCLRAAGKDVVKTLRNAIPTGRVVGQFESPERME